MIKVKDLIEKLQRVNPESEVYASIDLGDENHFENALGKGLIEVINDERNKAILLSFEIGEIVK